jgi:hypothetical protein
MSNGTDQQANCVLEVCCGGNDGAKQKRALKEIIHHYLGDNPPTVENIIDVLVDYFDFAEKGTLKPFKDSIARLARGNPYV